MGAFLGSDTPTRLSCPLGAVKGVEEANERGRSQAIYWEATQLALFFLEAFKK